MISPGVRAGTDGREAIAALGVRKRMSKTGEVRVERRVMLIVFVEIAAGRVGLPHFHESVRDGVTVFITHDTADDDAFALRFAGMLAREVASFYVNKFGAKCRAGNFRKCVPHMNQRLRWSALQRRKISGMQIIRLSAWMEATVAGDF